ncbi:MAG: hypothetical protein H6983_17520 [Ectothiorhodospiraceae bacterium]|nr:hypothetical protein [Chromatiales bacterium]MCP5155975.1 hypothetical protein [Ectothiorhodospiraceae bacterium]
MGRLVGAAALLLGAGCARVDLAPSGPALEPGPGEAVVYFFRPNTLLGQGVNFTVHEGDAVLGAVAPGTYFRVVVPAGPHRFHAETWGAAAITVNLGSGETAWVETTLDGTAVGLAPRLERVGASRWEDVRRGLRRGELVRG